MKITNRRKIAKEKVQEVHLHIQGSHKKHKTEAINIYVEDWKAEKQGPATTYYETRIPKRWHCVHFVLAIYWTYFYELPAMSVWTIKKSEKKKHPKIVKPPVQMCQHML